MTDVYHVIVKIGVDEMAELERQPSPVVDSGKPLYYSTGQKGVVKFWPPFGQQNLDLFWKEP